MNLPDSFYIALCMTVLLVGAVYWVWTQIQYVQRKVNVLENIVYELKQVCEGLGRSQYQNNGVAGVPAAVHPSSQTSPDVFADAAISSSTIHPPNSPPRYPPAPPSVIDEDDDLLHETLQREEQQFDFAPEEPLSLSEGDLSPLQHEEESFDAPQEIGTADISFAPLVEAADDLQPGGVGSGEVAEVSSLDTMTVKELRRLAAQRGISGAADLPKKKLIAAIKAAPSDTFTLDAHL